MATDFPHPSERTGRRPRSITTAGTDSDRAGPTAGHGFRSDAVVAPDMTVIGFLSTAPVSDEPMSDQVANAVEAIDETGVTYQTGPMGTTIEAESIEELFEAVQAAHEAIDADRVSTLLKVDDRRDSEKGAWEKVDTVEQALGRPATNRDQRQGRPAPDHDD